ncbi:MAG: IMPACT family protein, partial [Clostridiales bacterium]|nr:IMPACT family protein [Clostridiales bacterium]
MLILPKTGAFEYEEKRSKFLGFCAPITTEEDARKIIAEIRATHPKANHNVFAYAVGSVTRASDDGEPHGTAGMPVLNVFQKNGVINYVCVITRYFGGTLLGAGGLVRAYSKTAKGAMENAEPQEQIISKIYSVTCPYASFDKTKYFFEKLGVEILETSYTDHCALTVRVKEKHALQFLQGAGYT